MPSARRSAQAKGCGLPSSAASWTQARVCRSEKSSTACGAQRGRGAQWLWLRREGHVISWKKPCHCGPQGCNSQCNLTQQKLKADSSGKSTHNALILDDDPHPVGAQPEVSLQRVREGRVVDSPFHPPWQRLRCGVERLRRLLLAEVGQEGEGVRVVNPIPAWQRAGGREGGAADAATLAACHRWPLPALPVADEALGRGLLLTLLPGGAGKQLSSLQAHRERDALPLRSPCGRCFSRRVRHARPHAVL